MKILCVHQGAELYGSDRSFISSVEGFRKKYPSSVIHIKLHCDGPLVDHLKVHSDKIMIGKVAKLSKSELRRLNFTVLWALIRNLKKVVKESKDYDLIYINTIVVLDYILASRFFPKKTRKIIHVREIQPGLIGSVFSKLLFFSQARLIFNSKSTRQCFFPDSADPSHSILYNGVKQVHAPKNSLIDNLNLLVVGRVSNWKGQDFLIDVLDRLDEAIKQKINLRIVGGVYPGDQDILFKLKRKIRTANLDQIVQIFDFSESMEAHYSWANAVIIPSRKPEPFGRVAIEAMSAGRVVIAANHGGLSEIVDDMRTGLMFEPNSLQSAGEKIAFLLANRDVVDSLSASALQEYYKRFSENIYIQNFMKIV